MTTHDKIHIRQAIKNDIEAMVLLLKNLFELEKDFTFDPNRQKAGLENLLNTGQGLVLVAEHQHQVVGMCTGQTVISTAEGGPALLVEDVVVNSEWHGQGIGRQLLDSLSAWATRQGINRMQLLTDRNNHEALGFYEKIGWQRTELICFRTYTGE